MSFSRKRDYESDLQQQTQMQQQQSIQQQGPGHVPSVERHPQHQEQLPLHRSGPYQRQPMKEQQQQPYGDLSLQETVTLPPQQQHQQEQQLDDMLWDGKKHIFLTSGFHISNLTL